MKKEKQKSHILSQLTLSVLMLLGSCAKDKPYEVEYKSVNQLQKSSIDTESTYLYVPMTLGTPMNVKEVSPYVQGDEKLVKIKWTEEGLSVYEIEDDERFSDNDQNNSPVLTIPGDYTAYRCQTDAYGDCTNKEEENNDLEWYEKNNFDPNYKDLDVKEVNSLDIYALENDGCLTLESTEFVEDNSTINSDIINIELIKTYKASSTDLSCLYGSLIDDNLSASSFTVRYFYSLVKLKDIASDDYESVKYPEVDQNRFGFFALEDLVLNDSYDSQRKEKKQLLERWNPKKGSLKYYLSPEFSKEENRFVKEAAFEAISQMNSEFSNNGIPLNIELIEQTGKGVSPGDLRYNSIVLIEDPLANNVLGYGPTVSNPLTGEILKGTVNMYLGGLKSTTRSIYDSAIDLTQQKKDAERAASKDQGPRAPKTTFKLASSALPHIPKDIHFLYGAVETKSSRTNSDTSTDILSEVDTEKVGHDQITGSAASLAEAKLAKVDLQSLSRKVQTRLHTKRDMSLRAKLNQMKEKGSLNEADQEYLNYKAKIEEMSEKNILSSEHLTVGGTSKVIYKDLIAIDGITNEEGVLKEWDLLTKAQQTLAQEIIVKNSFKSTLIHELGHNLGLRHNFMGSVDSENFFNEEEANAHGLEAAPAYSSIMDYSFSEFNQLKVFGKYDIAALKFGYNREVELSNGSTMKVDTTLEQSLNALQSEQEGLDEADKVSLKYYQYCTDENAELSSFCNRFDEGSTLKEIVLHRIEKYKNSYKRINFRNGRREFNAYQMPNYIFYRSYELGKIRDVIEEYEFFVEIYGEELMSNGCSRALSQDYPGPCKVINDYVNATRIAGMFFTEILSTPDHLCAVAEEAKPTIVVDQMKLYDIFHDQRFPSLDVPASCFDDSVKEFLASDSLVPVAEAGKFLNGFKDNDPEYKYVTDRYVKGTWPDKMLAMKYLFKRRWTGATSDDNFLSLMDIPFVEDKVLDYILHITAGFEMKNRVSFKTEEGESVLLNYAIDESYLVNPIEDTFDWLRPLLGINSTGQVDLRKLLLNQIEREGTSYGGQYKDMAYYMKNQVTVQRTTGVVPQDMKEEGARYLYDGKLRTTYTAVSANTLSNAFIFAINNHEELEKFSRERMDGIYDLLYGENIPLPADIKLSDEEVVFYEIASDYQEMLINYAESEDEITSRMIPLGRLVDADKVELLASIYDQGADAMKAVKEVKDQVIAQKKAELDELELSILDQPLWLMDLIYNGAVTEAYAEYLLKSLPLLPEFELHQDAKIDSDESLKNLFNLF